MYKLVFLISKININLLITKSQPTLCRHYGISIVTLYLCMMRVFVPKLITNITCHCANQISQCALFERLYRTHANVFSNCDKEIRVAICAGGAQSQRFYNPTKYKLLKIKKVKNFFFMVWRRAADLYQQQRQD